MVSNGSDYQYIVPNLVFSENLFQIVPILTNLTSSDPILSNSVPILNNFDQFCSHFNQFYSVFDHFSNIPLAHFGKKWKWITT